MMKGILRYAATVGMAGAMAIAAASSSSAVEAKKHKTQESGVAAPVAQATGPAPPPLPGYINAPNACVLDDGYGRFQPCAGFN